METIEYHKMHELEHTNWWYVSRTNLIHGLLTKYSPHFESILDVGCGTGTILESFPGKRRVGIETNPTAIKYASSKGLVTHPDVQSVEGTFDVVLLMDVLEHVPDDVSFLKNVLKKVSAGGIAIITVPAFQWLWSAHDEQVHHVRRYSYGTLADLITNANATNMYTSYWNASFFLPSLVKKKFLSSKEQSDLSEVAEPINGILTTLLKLENKFSMRIPIPIGTSVYSVIKNK